MTMIMRGKRQLFATTLGLLMLFLMALVVYSFWIQYLASILIKSAASITTEDNLRVELARLQRFPGINVLTSSTSDTSQDQVIVANTFLSDLHLYVPTHLQVNISTASGQLTKIAVIEYTGSGAAPIGAWVQENFNETTKPEMHIAGQKDANGDYWHVTVDFDSTVSPQERARLLNLNTGCLTKLHGCKSVSEILPITELVGSRPST